MAVAWDLSGFIELTRWRTGGTIPGSVWAAFYFADSLKTHEIPFNAPVPLFITQVLRRMFPFISLGIQGTSSDPLILYDRIVPGRNFRGRNYEIRYVC